VEVAALHRNGATAAGVCMIFCRNLRQAIDFAALLSQSRKLALLTCAIENISSHGGPRRYFTLSKLGEVENVLSKNFSMRIRRLFLSIAISPGYRA